MSWCLPCEVQNERHNIVRIPFLQLVHDRFSRLCICGCVHEQKERCMYILVALQPFVLRLLCGAGLALLELA